MIKGNVLHNTNVWFYVPDEFELINPPDSESWRQGADYNPPNIRTVKVLIGTLSTGPYIRGSIKIKTPNTPGKYEVSYKVFAEGYEGGTKQSMVFLVS